MVESSVLAGIGGVLGLGMGWTAVRLLVAGAPTSLPRLEAIQMDPLVLTVALLATTASALFFGVLPALRASRTDLSTLLGERQGSGTRRHRQLSQGLVVAEVAISVALLVGTGLLLRSFSGLMEVNPGFQSQGVLTFGLSTTNQGQTPEEGRSLLEDYLSRIEAIPGVAAAGVTNDITVLWG